MGCLSQRLHRYSRSHHWMFSWTPRMGRCENGAKTPRISRHSIVAQARTTVKTVIVHTAVDTHIVRRH